MSVGSIKPLFQALQSAPTLQGLSVAFGEENISAQDYALPYVCIVPTGGQYVTGQGYIKAADLNIDAIWGVQTQFDLYLWAHSEDAAAEAFDHADAVENFRALVLQALQYQRPDGLFYFPVSERWQLIENAQSRFGRALVLTVQCELSIPGVLPPLAEVDAVDLTQSITASA